MKKLTLHVSASLLAVAGCGGDPAPKHPEEIYTNSVVAVDPSAVPTASASAAPSAVPSQVPPQDLETNARPRPEDFVRTTNATPVEMPPVPAPSSSAKPTKPTKPTTPVVPTHTNSQPH